MASLKGVLVSLIVASLFVVGFMMGITDLSSQYNKNMSDEMNGTLQNFSTQYDDLTQSVTESRNKSFKTEANQDVTSGINLGNALITTKNLITDAFSTANHMLGQVGRWLGIPAEYRSAAIAVVTITMILVFLGAVLNKNLSSR